MSVGLGETPVALKVTTQMWAPGIGAAVLTNAVRTGAGLPVTPVVGLNVSQAQSEPSVALNGTPVETLETVIVCGAGAAAPAAYVPKLSNVGVSVRLGLLTVSVAVTVGLGEMPGAEKVMAQVCVPAVAARRVDGCRKSGGRCAGRPAGGVQAQPGAVRAERGAECQTGRIARHGDALWRGRGASD